MSSTHREQCSLLEVGACDRDYRPRPCVRTWKWARAGEQLCRATRAAHGDDTARHGISMRRHRIFDRTGDDDKDAAEKWPPPRAALPAEQTSAHGATRAII